MIIAFTILAKGMFMPWVIMYFPLHAISQIHSESMVWKFSSGGMYSAPLVVGSIANFGGYEANVYAISLKDKHEKWIPKADTSHWDGSVVSEIVVDNNVLYFGRYTNSMIPLNLETGEPLWKFTDPNTFLPSPPFLLKECNRQYNDRLEPHLCIQKGNRRKMLLTRHLIMKSAVLEG